MTAIINLLAKEVFMIPNTRSSAAGKSSLTGKWAKPLFTDFHVRQI